MLNQITQDAIQHAKKEAPLESCGLVIIYKGRKKYVPCQNVNLNPKNAFTINAEDYVKASNMGEIIYVVHSHPKQNARPSQGDLAAIELDTIPWLIVNPITEQHTITKPSGYIAPYVGREFSAGVLDCYSIIHDYYRGEINIPIPNFERADKWWETNKDLYRDHYSEAGFFKLDTSKKILKHDVIIMFSHASVPNHGAIYLGDGKILHHVQGRLSSIDVYGGYWQKNTWGILRHRELYENS